MQRKLLLIYFINECLLTATLWQALWAPQVQQWTKSSPFPHEVYIVLLLNISVESSPSTEMLLAKDLVQLCQNFLIIL